MSEENTIETMVRDLEELARRDQSDGQPKASDAFQPAA
jgi:hypothetical protein